MAEIYKPEPISAPNYTQFIRGIDTNAIKRAQIGSAGEVIKGAAQTLDATAKGVTNAYDIHLENTLKPDLQKIQESKGADYISKGGPSIFDPKGFYDATNGAHAEADDGDLPNAFDQKVKDAKVRGYPPGVATITSELPKYQRAYEAGNMSPTQYWMQMQSRVSQAKAQYPGFTDKIDQIASQVTGGRPADELRKAMLAEADARARAGSEGTDKRQQFILSNTEHLSTALGDKWASQVQGMPLEQIASIVGNVKAKQANEDRDYKRLEHIKAMGGDVGLEVTTQARAAGDYRMTNDINKFYGGVDFSKVIEQAGTKGLDAESQNQLASIFEREQAKGLNQFDQDMQKYRRLGLSRDEAEKMRTDYKARWAEVHEALTNKDTGVLYSTQRLGKAQLDDSDQFLNRTVPGYTTMKTLQRAFPQMAFEVITQISKGKNITDLQDAYSKASAAKAQIDPGHSSVGSDLNSLIEEAKRTGKPLATSNALNTLVDMHMAPLEHPESFTDEARANAVSALFMNDGQGGNKAMLSLPRTQADKEKLWSRLTNPKVMEQIYKVAQTKPTIEQGMDAWMKENFASLFGGKAQNLSLFTEPGQSTKEMKFNPSTFQIEVKEKAGQEPGYATYKRERILGGRSQTAQESTVNDMNTALLSLKTWAEKTKQDPNQFINELFGRYMGISLDNKKSQNPFSGLLEVLPTSDKPAESSKKQ